MTKDEAVEAIVKGGTAVIGVTVHPRAFGLFEYAEIIARALKRRPDLLAEIVDPQKTEATRLRCLASMNRN